jgi:hypothetical protein
MIEEKPNYGEGIQRVLLIKFKYAWTKKMRTTIFKGSIAILASSVLYEKKIPMMMIESRFHFFLSLLITKQFKNSKKFCDCFQKLESCSIVKTRTTYCFLYLLLALRSMLLFFSFFSCLLLFFLVLNK